MKIKLEVIKGKDDEKMSYNVSLIGIETNMTFSTYDKKEAKSRKDWCQGIIDYYESIIRNKQV